MSERTARDRSRSPRKHRSDRSPEHRSKHSKSHRHRDAEDEGREHKHRRDRDREETEEERKDRKRHKKEKRREDRKDKDKLGVVDDDDDAGMWVEKGADTDAVVASVPAAAGLPLRSHASEKAKAPLPDSTSTGSKPQERESWMLEPSVTAPPVTSNPFGERSTPRSASASAPHSQPISSDMTDGYGEDETSNRTLGGGVDFFSALGTEHQRKDPKADLPDPTKLQIYDTELNKQLLQGKKLDEYEEVKEKKVQPGSAGHQWRMMKLKRLYEQAKDQDRPVEEIALERYGSMDEFNEALAERQYLDEKDQRRQSRRGLNSNTDSPSTSGMRTPDLGARKYMFTTEEGFGSRPSSRAGFRRPGEEREGGASTPSLGRVEDLRRKEMGTPSAAPRTAASKVSTPIPSVFTPQNLKRADSGYPFPQDSSTVDPTSSKPPMSTEELNKLQAKVLRARLSDDPEADNMEADYEREVARTKQAMAGGMWEGSGDGVQGQMGREVDGKGRQVDVQVLPTLDGRGRLYDVGTGKQDEEILRPGNRRKKPEKFETRDREGNLLRYNKDDDELTLGELVRQEKFGAGSADQKNLDAEMASAIARDGKYQDDNDYVDDNAEKLARKKMKTDALKRAFAINDYARTKRALDSCPFCWQDDRNPLAAVVALGQKTYLSCTLTEELVSGHCLIVPQQHYMSSLEMDDEEWDEVRNFMKCLMKMHAKDNKGVLFYETICSFRQQRHTVIEAVPMPFDQFQDAPAYFRESIMASESEWSQHKKLIDFSTRPGGFRRSLVPNLPYFMVHWDYKGEKGYGHIIEGIEDAAGRGEGEEGMGGPIDEGDRGGGQFPAYFAAEIIGNMLELEPRKWRKPKRLDYALNQQRAADLGNWFQPYNWTVQLSK